MSIQFAQKPKSKIQEPLKPAVSMQAAYLYLNRKGYETLSYNELANGGEAAKNLAVRIAYDKDARRLYFVSGKPQNGEHVLHFKRESRSVGATAIYRQFKIPVFNSYKAELQGPTDVDGNPAHWIEVEDQMK